MRSPLRYPGGKTRAVKTILALLPQGGKLYSPFIGGASVELAWLNENPTGEIIARDVFHPLVCFWDEMSRGNQRSLAMAARKYLPMTKPTFYRLQEELRGGDLSRFQTALYFFVLNRSSFNGSTLSGGMGEGDRFNAASCDRLEELSLERFHIQSGDVFDSIRRRTDRFRQGFLFLDPPYLLKSPKLYGDKGSTHDGFNHTRLMRILRKLDTAGHKWLLTYNDTPAIRSLYDGLPMTSTTWSYGMSKNTQGKELIVTSSNLRGDLKNVA